MANLIHLAVFALLSIALSPEIINAHPLSPEDVESLLPSTPKTKNETVEAIVADAVIQDVVQSVVGDGTLSGLVVKKNTVILPADQPETILTQNEQILTAPLAHLEDIRKNITETVATTSEKENSEVTGVEEISVAEVVPVDDEGVPNPADLLITAPENPHEILVADSLILDKGGPSTLTSAVNSADKLAGEKLVVPGIVQGEIKLPEGIGPGNISLPTVIEDEISEPVVAVVNKDKETGYRGSVIEFLPASYAAKNTGEKLDDEKAEYGARIPVAVLTSEELGHPSFNNEMRDVEASKNDKNFAAAFSAGKDDSIYRQSEDTDMVAAEDIIFRPLFRYRQQQNDRLRLLENRAYQRTSYSRYRPSDSASYFGDYNPRKNSYRKPQRPKYYNDYF